MTIFRSWFTALFAVSTLFLTTSVFAETTLNVPRPYSVYLVDGKDHKGFGHTLQFAEGDHQVVIRFEGNFSTSKDIHLVNAEPLVVNFKTNGQEQLTFDIPVLRDAVQAKQFVKTQNVHLIDEQTKAAKDADIFVMPKKEGVQIGRNYQDELLELGKAYHQPIFHEDGTISAGDGTQITNNSANVSDNKQIQTLEMLKYWYNRADPQTRKTFQYWIISQQ